MERMPESLKKTLSESVKEQLESRPLGRIRVRRLCRQNGVKRRLFRSSFHYRQGFLDWVFYSEFVPRIVRCSGESGDFANSVCAYFYENRAVYRNVFAAPRRNAFNRSFDIVTPIIIRDYIEARYAHDERAREILLASCPVLVDMFRDALTGWLCAEEPVPPEVFARGCNRNLDAFADMALSCESA